MEKAEHDIEPTRAEQPSDISRWLSAMAYAFVVAVFVLYEARKRPGDEYLKYHAKQGFVLFFVEFTLLIASMVLHSALHDIRVVGVVVLVTWDLAFGLLAIGVSAMGFMYGLSGEKWQMPFLWRYSDRVPLD